MEDGEQEGLRISLNGDPRYLVAAATVATLFLAGSALWRSSIMSPRLAITENNRNESGLTDPDAIVRSEPPSVSEEKSPADGPSKDTRNKVLDEVTPLSQEVESKSTRTKDRRRRGKDPLKEILKSGKKAKAFLGKVGDVAEKTDVMPPMAHIPESTPSPRSRKIPTDSSTRSLSVSAASSHRMHGSATSNHSHEVSQSGQGSGTDDFSCGFTTPSVVSELEELSLSLDGLDTPESQNSDLPAKPLEPREILATQASDSLPQASSSSPTSHSSSSATSSSVITPNTSPTISLNEDISTPTLVHPSVSLPADLSPIPKAKSQVSSRQLAKVSDPWDWATPTPPETTYRKPPRFQGKSRGAGTPTPLSISSPPASPSSGVPGSASHPTLISPYSAVVASSRSTPPVVLEEPSAEEPTPLTFPTLNPSTSNSSQPMSPNPNRKRNSAADINSAAGASTSNGTGYGNTGTPTRRAPTPRRPPTPSSGTNTPPPSLSAQTQLASLRGALEAARLREEKSKSDIERYLKEMEVLRWENVTCRRREAELQTQVHYLMNQLQAYAALFASMPPQPPQMQSPTGSGSTSNGGGNGSTPNGFPAQNPPLHPPPLHLQMLSSMHMFPVNGNQSPATLVSPGTPHSGGGQPSPFFPHPMHSHSHTPQPPPPQSQSQSHPSPHQANLFSTFFPPSGGSGPSSAAGSSSVGSASPDLNGSPSPTPAMLDRGMIRARTRTQTANGRIGGLGNMWEGADNDGWIGMGEDNDTRGLEGDEEGGRGHDDDGGDGDDDFNELLADAILKRPGSIRVRKKGVKEGKERAPPVENEEQHTEFTFPSLSELGNVSRAKRGSVDNVNVESVLGKENVVAAATHEECTSASLVEGSPRASATEIKPTESEEDHNPSEQC